MPLTRSQVAKDEATVPVSAYGETLNITYYPSKMTDEFFINFANIENRINKKDSTDLEAALKDINEMLADNIKSWDFYEDEEQKVMVPITAETFASIELSLKFTCLYGILGHVRPESKGASEPQNSAN